MAEYRNYLPPAEPVAHIEKLIRNGALRDRVDLDAELRALHITNQRDITLLVDLLEQASA